MEGSCLPSVSPARLHFPPELPVSQKREEIARAIRDNQVVIVAGETGSGKTTQLPKICLELGRESIGHTQPRRIAARTIAERIAEELGEEVGGLVGYQVRFTDRVGARTRIKLMTDGILLNEIHRDRMLRKYDTIIIDEAHERSLNIDFLIGYLRELLPKRPDLKVIVTSATIDPRELRRAISRPRRDTGADRSRSRAAPSRSRSATARSSARSRRTTTARPVESARQGLPAGHQRRPRRARPRVERRRARVPLR